jgi:hypothetical protein
VVDDCDVGIADAVGWVVDDGCVVDDGLMVDDCDVGIIDADG